MELRIFAVWSVLVLGLGAWFHLDGEIPAFWGSPPVATPEEKAAFETVSPEITRILYVAGDRVRALGRDLDDRGTLPPVEQARQLRSRSDRAASLALEWRSLARELRSIRHPGLSESVEVWLLDFATRVEGWAERTEACLGPLEPLRQGGANSARDDEVRTEFEACLSAALSEVLRDTAATSASLQEIAAPHDES